jgi:hypothetical protein
MPEVGPIEVRAGGDTVETITRKKQFQATTHLTRDNIPTSYRDRQLSNSEGLAVYISAIQAEPEWTYSDIHEQVNNSLQAIQLPTLSYSKLRNLLRWFYNLDKQTPSTTMTDNTTQSEPQSSSTNHQTADSPAQNSNITPDAERLREKTASQQAILITDVYGKVVDDTQPDYNYTEIANLVGCGRSYPSQLFNDHSSGVDLSALRDRIVEEAEQRGFEEVLLTRCTREDLSQILDEGYLDDLDLDLEALIEQKIEQTSERTGAEVRTATAGPTEDDHSETQSQSTDQADDHSETQPNSIYRPEQETTHTDQTTEDKPVDKPVSQGQDILSATPSMDSPQEEATSASSQATDTSTAPPKETQSESTSTDSTPTQKKEGDADTKPGKEDTDSQPDTSTQTHTPDSSRSQQDSSSTEGQPSDQTTEPTDNTQSSSGTQTTQTPTESQTQPNSTGHSQQTEQSDSTESHTQTHSSTPQQSSPQAQPTQSSESQTPQSGAPQSGTTVQVVSPHQQTPDTTQADNQPQPSETDTQPAPSPQQGGQHAVSTFVADVEQVHTFIQWQREMIDYEVDLSEADPQQQRLYSLLAQIEGRLEDALDSVQGEPES